MGLNSVVADMMTCSPGYISERGILELKLKDLIVHWAQDGCGMALPENWRGSQQLLEKAPCLVVVDGSRSLGRTRKPPLILLPSKQPQGSMSQQPEPGRAAAHF